MVSVEDLKQKKNQYGNKKKIDEKHISDIFCENNFK